MTAPMDVFQFSDYRSFLKSHAEAQKGRNPKWTFGLWAKKLGLAGTASLTMVLNGQRSPGRNLTEKIIHYFGFPPKHAAFFRDLVKLDKMRGDPELSAMLIEKLKRAHPAKTFRKLDDQAFSVLAHWHYNAIREMTHLKDFSEDAAWISSRLDHKISRREAKAAIAKLIAMQILTRDANRRLRPAEMTIEAGGGGANEAIRSYHRQCLDLAAHSLEKVAVERRTFCSQTMTIDVAQMDRAKVLLAKFQDDMAKLMETGGGNQVYQFNMQLFPLTT